MVEMIRFMAELLLVLALLRLLQQSAPDSASGKALAYLLH